jgi:trimethylamine:corrinoid methyltransferase-like protein
VIDRGSLRAWQEQGKLDTFERATSRVVELEKSYQQPTLSQELKKNMEKAVSW